MADDTNITPRAFFIGLHSVARKINDSSTSFDAVETSLKEKKFSPLYLFHGEEDFLIDELVTLLISGVVDESTRSFNLDIVYGADHDAKAIVSLASAYPMMADRRVVIIKDFDKLTNKESLLSYLDHPSPTTSLAIISAKPDFRQKIYKSLKEKSVAVECKQLYDDRISGWIDQRIRKLGKRASLEACLLMQGYVSRSLREIQNEIDKLFIYVGEKKEITVDDVNSVVGMSKQFNIFELQKAIGKKEIGHSIEVLERMLDAGESPLYVIVMIAKYFQKLWIVPELRPQYPSEYQLAGALGVSSFFVKDYLEAARRYSLAEVERCFEALLQADLKLKTSSPDPKYVMTFLLYSIIQSEVAHVFA